ncbi:uncharacterized protein PV09_04909 [Verruconis gallopava]|uniref:Transcription factor CBF/NF-Y/archaeal histone domain-containing protein n=1 Tax=Verruconis gallopava TaxID=253628 RepID=A0A0D1YTW4_9PEZI|nr:uncharacterized protein PV09_04909 [Verruconis gallopava]KIW04092.1 hypothetical protein PV09_04909 [Verruconis gallopava]
MSSPQPKKAEAEAVEVDQTTPDINDQNGQKAPMDPSDTQGHEIEVKEQDRWLPIANVARIMKSALPENAKIAKEAKECMQECVSEFISFITSEASEKCQQEKRKTVNGEDILFAMTSLGFENYAEALKIYLARYRETLLATQKSGAPGATGTSAGPNAAAAGAYSENDNGLLGGNGLDEGSYDPAFSGAVHNGNGTAEGY